jgi:hypothetical protein
MWFLATTLILTGLFLLLYEKLSDPAATVFRDDNQEGST